ncbi:MAG: hypothetical protein EXQ55_01230 [Acidobacteria bacterium]|nr:hypothetical protein [Acidobacteriota bacterium]
MDDFKQAGDLCRLQPKDAQQRLVDNIAGSLAQVSRDDIITRSVDGRTALGMAAAFNRTPMVQWLLQHGASRDVGDASGMRPIDMAQSLGAIEAVAVLAEPVAMTRA